MDRSHPAAVGETMADLGDPVPALDEQALQREGSISSPFCHRMETLTLRRKSWSPMYLLHSL